MARSSRMLAPALLVAGLMFFAAAPRSGSAQADRPTADPHDHGHVKHHEGILHQQGMNRMMLEQLGEPDALYDQRFLDLMIHHHQGAVAMAEHALKNARHAELRNKARKMLESQADEIRQMKAWREEWYPARDR